MDTNTETEQIDRWISEHGNCVRNYLLGIVRRTDLAEDLYQDVFIKATITIDRYEERGCSKAYLLRIAQRVARAHFRRRKHERLLSEQQWNVLEPASESASDHKLLLNEARTELSLAMTQLSPIQRRVLCLRYYSDLDFQSIADLLDCPISTVHSHCRRAIALLRKKLDEQ